MHVARLLMVALAGIAAVLLIAAMFVPWQTGSFFGVSIGPGLWNVQTDGFGEPDGQPYSEYDNVEGAAKTLLVLARISALIGVVAAAAVAVMTFRSKGRPDRRLTMASGGAALSTALAVVFFERGVKESFDNAGGFFALTHGSFLSIAAAVLLAAGMAASLLLGDADVRLERQGDPPGGLP